jgi:SAM-dependent methyltransferase
MRSESNEYWRDYFSDVASRGNTWLDYSNAKVQLQSLALCLESAGEIAGKSCLDVGCGHGQLSIMLKALESASVVGSDFVSALVEKNKRAVPGIDWRHGDVNDPGFVEELPEFDLIFMVEVLQYTDATAVVPCVWRRLKPGGRLIGMVPNRECPIVARTNERLQQRYHAVGPSELAALADGLEDLDFWGVRGLTFGDDQRIAPYWVGGWSTATTFTRPPNRLNFVFAKA